MTVKGLAPRTIGLLLLNSADEEEIALAQGAGLQNDGELVIFPNGLRRDVFEEEPGVPSVAARNSLKVVALSMSAFSYWTSTEQTRAVVNTQRGVQV